MNGTKVDKLVSITKLKPSEFISLYRVLQECLVSLESSLISGELGDECWQTLNQNLYSLTIISRDFGSKTSSIDARLAWLLIYKNAQNKSEFSIEEAENLLRISRASLLRKRKKFDLRVRGNSVSITKRSLEVSKVIVLWKSSQELYERDGRNEAIRIPPIPLVPDLPILGLLSIISRMNPEEFAGLTLGQIVNLINNWEDFLALYAKRINLKLEDLMWMRMRVEKNPDI